MRRVPQLRCRACGHVVDAERLQYCELCFGPLDIVFDLRRAPVDRETIESGPRSIWRYGALLPHDRGPHAGWTPLARAHTLGEVLGLDDLWLKDDTRNPTGSFKDRLVATAVARAHELGARVLACASTGNLARAVGVAARSRGMAAVVLIPAGMPVPGAIQVAGGYDAVNRLSIEAAMRWESWAWVNVGLRPFYVEGAATLAYETAEQLGWTAADHVLAPIASGASLLRLHRAFGELAKAGLLDDTPTVRLSAAQPSGCAPVAAAFVAGAEDVRP
ncbi:MAG: threonine synthase, partial [Acidimicrobiales bacterium]